MQFMISMKYTEQGMRTIKDAPNRAKAARELAKKMGVEIKSIYLTTGESDLVSFVEASNGDNSRLPELAKELYALKPRVFVTAANAIVPVLQLPRDTPIVFTGFAADPIKLGLVQSYPKPGGMITGNVMNAVGGEESLTEK